MLRALFWRSALLVLGLLWLAVAVADIHQMIVDGGLFVWTVGLVHALVFLFLGLGTCLLAVLVDAANARDAMIGFAQEVCSLKNLFHMSTILVIAALVALVLVALRR